MVFSSFTSFITTVAFGSVFAGGAPSAPTGAHVSRVSADSAVFDTTQVVVTTADFTQLANFLQATASEWSKQDVVQLMSQNIVKYPMALGSVTLPSSPQYDQVKPGALVPIPNYALIAQKVPAVAQGLAGAKLTGARYMQLSRTLNCATVTDLIDRATHGGKPSALGTTSVIDKNVAFIRAHDADFQKLVSMALDVYSPQAAAQGGGGGDNSDLNP